MRPHALLAALLLAAPAAAASWSVEGNVEPDTPQDQAGHMWAGPPQPDREQAYFNVVATSSHDPGAGPAARHEINPNALPGSRVAPASLAFVAWLGVWRDCNGDGYVGMADGALWAYRSELLPAGSPCLDGSAHRDEGWVYEFRWIHPYGADSVSVLRGVSAAGARVWGDFGRPGEGPASACEAYPMPAGTLRSTGGLLAYVGCQTGFLATRTTNEALGDAAPGLRWDDPAHPERDCDHPLNQQTIWGDKRCDGPAGAWERGSGRPAATVWDCGARREDAWQEVRDPTAPEGEDGRLNGTVHDPTGELSSRNLLFDRATGAWTPARLSEDGDYAWFSQPAPRADHAADGSWYDAAGLARGNMHCRQTSTSVVGPGAENPLLATQPDGPMLRSRGLENEQRTGLDDVKRSHDLTFSFDFTGLSNRSNHPTSLGALNALDPYAGDATNHTPYALGLTQGLHLRGGGWVTNETFRPPSYHGGLLRQDLGPASGAWFTFYASVGAKAATLGLPAPGLGLYGAEACPGGFDGGVGPTGWDCDASRWWRPETGAPAGTVWTVPLGRPYHLRDVDCYDGRAATQPAPVYASLAPLSDDRANACPP